MCIWIAIKFTKFHAKRLNWSENIPKSFRGVTFLKHPVHTMGKTLTVPLALGLYTWHLQPAVFLSQIRCLEFCQNRQRQLQMLLNTFYFSTFSTLRYSDKLTAYQYLFWGNSDQDLLPEYTELASSFISWLIGYVEVVYTAIIDYSEFHRQLLLSNNEVVQKVGE